MTSRASRRAAFAGFGLSRVFRHAEVPLGQLAVDASMTAIEDAGLEVSQIDGLVCTPDPPFAMAHELQEGTHYVSTRYMTQELGIAPEWTGEVPGTIGNSAIEAVRAIEAGECDTILLFRALHSPKGGYGHTAEQGIGGPMQYFGPYGLFPPGLTCGMPWTKYQQKYKTGTREQMATYVIQERRNGLLFDGGYWSLHHPQELTVDEYLNARMVSSPASIFDCDLPIQGAGAFIVTTAERARDLAHPPAYVLGTAQITPPKEPVVDPFRTLEVQVEFGRDIARQLWATTGLGPKDIDVADLYDGFSMITMCWLESLGFCGEGEAFDFIQNGRIALDGELPVNPSGGNLGGGRLHGVNHLMDAVLQVMGRSGPRQVPDVDVALAAIGPASPIAGALILGSEAP